MDDNVSVKSIEVERHPEYISSIATFGVAFTVRFKVTGEHVDKVRIRQIIRSEAHWTDYEGNDMSRDQILAQLSGTDPNVVDSQDQWPEDTDWGWDGPNAELTIDPESNNGVGFSAPDGHTINVTNELGQAGEMQVYAGYLAWQKRDLVVELKQVGKADVLKSHPWGYTWSNWPVRWMPDANPAPPHQWCAGSHIALSELIGEYGWPSPF